MNLVRSSFCEVRVDFPPPEQWVLTTAERGVPCIGNRESRVGERRTSPGSRLEE